MSPGFPAFASGGPVFKALDREWGRGMEDDPAGRGKGGAAELSCQGSTGDAAPENRALCPGRGDCGSGLGLGPGKRAGRGVAARAGREVSRRQGI